MAVAKNTAAKAAPEVVKEEKPVVKKSATKAVAPKAEVAKKEAPAKAAATKAPAPEKESATIGRKQLGAALREKLQAQGIGISPKAAEAAAVAYEDSVVEALSRGDKVSLPGTMTLTVVAKAEQERPNPQKPGEKITVKAHNAAKFKAGSKLKAALNGGAEAAEGEDE